MEQIGNNKLFTDTQAAEIVAHRGNAGRPATITPDMTDDECAGVAYDLILGASIEELSRGPAEDCR